MSIVATCANIAAILASTSGGETIVLQGVCSRVIVKKMYRQIVNVDASAATIRGLSITGGNIQWSGGRIEAAGGVAARAPENYGLLVRGAQNVAIRQVTFGLSRKAVVIDKSNGIKLIKNSFDGYGEDGVIASASSHLTITDNRFINVVGKPSECNLNGHVTYELPKRKCDAMSGGWRDGFHADAIQLRNGIRSAVIARNFISGKTQGITQMDTNGDMPLEDILVEKNEVWGQVHQITLGGEGCIRCSIKSNKVRRFPGAAQWKAIIRQGPAFRCGNDVQDEKRDARC